MFWHAVTLAAVLGVSGCDSQKPLAVGTLERDRLELVAAEFEPIARYHVTEGQRVDKGELLAELDDSRLRARLDSARAARDAGAAALAELVRGTRREEIDEARARLAEAEAARLEAGPELERARSLVESGLEPTARLDRARAASDRALARVDAARALLDRLLHGATGEELDGAKARLAEASANLAEIEVDAERLRMVAPRSGLIDALPYEVGERPPTGAVVVVLLADGLPYARVYVPSDLRPHARPGTVASVTVEGVDGSFAGRVRTVSSDPVFTPFFALTERDRGRLSYVAEIDLVDEAARELPAGLPVEVDFETDPGS